MQFINVIYTKSTNISFNNFLIDEYHLIMWVSKPSTISNQQQLFRIMLGKDDIPPRWNNIWFFLLFEDKGRLHAHCEGIKSWLLPGKSLSSDFEWDCHPIGIKSRFRHSRPGLLYLIAGLVTITQFCLVHRILQEWSTLTQQNGVILTFSIRDKFTTDE